MKRKENGVPQAPAGTLAVMGDMKQMKTEWIVGTSFQGYGSTLTVGVGIPIPILDEEILKYASLKDEDLWAQVVAYSEDYPEGKVGSLGEVNYSQLRSGKITVKGKEVPTASLSSYPKAVEITEELKKWIKDKKFFLTEYVQALPGADSGYKFKPLIERPIS